MAKVSDMYLPAIINGMPFYTRRDVDEGAREAVRKCEPDETDVPLRAMQMQWSSFVSILSPSQVWH
jgi:hypothetical protein